MPAVTLLTGRSNNRESFAQLGDLGLIMNGHDANQVYDLRTGTAKTVGMAAPGAAPTGVAAAGVLTGAYIYRVRWWDSISGTISLPSAILSVTLTAQNYTVTRPGSPPARADFWILERTTAGGRIYYPVNYASATPNGTAIATTTYADSVTDATIRNRIAFHERQGQPPVLYNWIFANRAFLHAIGGRVHRPSCSLTNGAAAVTSTAGAFTSDMVGQDFSFDADTDGLAYQISVFTNSNAITIATNYTGTTKTAQPASISGKRNIEAWCEPYEAESWGAATVSGLANIETIGDDGGPLLSGVGLGTMGVLLAKEDRLFLHSYLLHPSGATAGGDGRIVPLQSRRGVCGSMCLKRVGPYVYGMDRYGVWRLVPGGEPEEIGDAIKKDWNGLYFTSKANFFIRYDPLWRLLYFCVCEGTDTYPRKDFAWDLMRERWIDTKTLPVAGKTCGVELPDGIGALRSLYYTAISGSVKSYPWFDNIGTNFGAPPGTVNLTGTVTSGSATTLANTGAAWPTAGEALNGIPVKLIRAAGTEETALIVSNTATVLTTTTWANGNPANLDTYEIALIPSTWKTGRLTAGDHTRKKTWNRVYIWLPNDSTAIALKVRAYYDGSATAYTYAVTKSEDAIATTASSAPATVTPASGQVRYYVNLDGQQAVDIQLEFYSSVPGSPWQILGVEVDYDGDTSAEPARG